MQTHWRYLLIINAALAFLVGLGLADSDDGDDPTMNVCITPRACFQNNGDDSVSYCITSGWYIKYPQQLRANMPHVNGVTPLDFGAADFDSCGWNLGLDGVYAKSVSRGWIYYKYTNATLETRPPKLPLDIAPVINMMKHTYPIVEIMVIIIFCVILPFGLPFACCLGYAFRDVWKKARKDRAWKKQEQRRQKAEKKARKMRSQGSSSNGSSSNTEGWNEKDMV